MRRTSGKLTQLVRRLAREKAEHELTQTSKGWGAYGLHGDGDYADAYADHLPTPFGEQHLHLNWRWGNYYWRITKQHNKLCGTNRCRRVHIDVAEFHRADSGAITCKCGLQNQLHPYEPFIKDQDDNVWLTRLCDGTLVKL